MHNGIDIFPLRSLFSLSMRASEAAEDLFGEGINMSNRELSSLPADLKLCGGMGPKRPVLSFSSLSHSTSYFSALSTSILVVDKRAALR